MKCDITISKKFTINTGDYSSIQPNLSITIKDVENENVIKIHPLLENIVDGLFHIQMLNDGKTMATLKKMGFGSFLSNLDENDIILEVKKSSDELMNIKDKF
jgi:hypothetical protein